MDQEKLQAMVSFLREEGAFLSEWAEDLEAGVDKDTSAETLASCVDIQIELLVCLALSLRGYHHMLSLLKVRPRVRQG